MKTTRLLIVCMLLSALAFGQATTQTETPQSFTKGTNVINLGVGIGGYYTYWGPGYAETPNFIISYENGTFGNVGPGTISLGGLFSFKSITYNYNDPYSTYYYKQNWTYWILGIRSAYHWNFFHNPKCDPYLGIMLGYYYLSYKLSSNDPYYNDPHDPYYSVYNANYGSYLAFSMYLGFRYYLSNTVGLWGELGYGYTTLALGVNFKF